MASAARLGISPRRFRGWEPTTFYVYDDAGRLVSSTPEAEWDDEQRALIEAEQIVRTNTGSNGEWLPEATSDDADPNNYVMRYVPSPEKTNWAEKARLDALDQIRKDKGENANMNGVYVTVEEYRYPVNDSENSGQ